MAFDAGTAYVSVLPQATGFISSLQRQVAPALSKIQAQGISTSKAIGASFVVAGALAAKGLSSAIHATEGWADSVRALQRTTGLAAEEASGLLFAANSLGLGVDKLSIGFGLLDKNIVNGTTNFTKYGIATKDASGTQLSFTTILGELADKYVELGGGINGAALAQNVFGKSGKNLIPLLAKGSEGLQSLIDQAQRFGLVIGQDVVDNAREAAIASRQLGLSFQGFEVQLGAQLLPLVETLVHGLTDVVGVLHLIPAPVVAAGAGFLVLSGALVGIVAASRAIGSAWSTVIATFTGGTTAAAAQAGAIEAQVTASTALAGVLPELTAALQAIAGSNAEVAASATAAGEALGFEATQSGLLVPTGAAAGIAAIGEDAAVASTGFAGLAAAAAPAALAIGAVVGAVILFRRENAAAHAAFEAGVQRDLTTLSFGSHTAVANLKALVTQLHSVHEVARTPSGQPIGLGITSQFGPGQLQAAQQAEEALRRYNQMQALAAQGSSELTDRLARTVRQMTDLSTTAALSTNQVSLIDAAIGKTVSGIGKLSNATGPDLSQIVSDFKGVADNAKSTFPQVAAAAKLMVSQTKDAFAQWHDSIAEAFGGAGSALDKFSGKLNVNIGSATGALTNYTAKIRSYGKSVETISDRYGKKAQAFIQWATSQGLAQQGLVASVARANEKNGASFVKAFNQGQSATSDLASEIQKTLDPAFQKIILQLKNIARAINGLPPIHLDDSQATSALNGLIAQLQTLNSTQYTAHVMVDVARGGGAGGIDHDPSTPFAAGFHGVISKPTLALIGEAGPERVDITPGGQHRGGSGQLSGRLAIADWHRGLMDLQGEISWMDWAQQ